MPAAGVSSWATCRLWNFIQAPPCHIHWDLKPEGKKQQTNKNQPSDDTNKTKPTTFQAHSLLVKQLEPTSGVALNRFQTIQRWEIFLRSSSPLKHAAFIRVQTQSSRAIKASKSAYWLKQSPPNCTHLKRNRTVLLATAAPGAACSAARWAAVGARAPRRAGGPPALPGPRLPLPWRRPADTAVARAAGRRRERASCFSCWRRVQPARAALWLTCTELNGCFK